MSSTSKTPEGSPSLTELAVVFLKLGSTSFGGPAAHIAMMEEELVRRRGWLSHEQFLDLLGATNLIPGPNSTEMAIHIGWRRARWMGLLIAGAGFILPSAVLVVAIAWAYVRFSTRPEAVAVLYGIKPVVVAVILQALWRLGTTAAKTKLLIVLGLAAGVLNAIGYDGIVILFGTGLIYATCRGFWGQSSRGNFTPLIPFAPLVVVKAGAVTPFGLWPLFLFFLKVGSVLFGSGYVLLAFLRTDLVDRLGWLTEPQLMDAIAVGQITPGPVSTTATFIGYVLGGLPGAVLATIGIFLPAFVFVAASGPLVPRIRRSKSAGAFLDGVNVASLALMAVVTWEIGRAAIVEVPTAVLAVVSSILLIRFRVNSSWLVFGGAALGLLISVLRAH